MYKRRSINRFAPSRSMVCLLIFLLAIWLAGGASRADVSGQLVVRGAAWGLLLATILVGEKFSFHRPRAIWLIVLAIVVLPLIQLIPLPPEIWALLPGRDPLLDASRVSGQPQVWRPWSIVPAATVNAASSLIVPLTALVLIGGLRAAERTLLPGILLVAVTASAIFGLLQFSGSTVDNPLINDAVGTVSGNFANRNHFALFMAIGCVLAPAWIFLGRRRSGWRGPVGFALVILFFLSILASGSRAGIALGVVALLLGVLLVREPISRALSRFPRWTFPVGVIGFLTVVAVFVIVSLRADRAVSIDRMLTIDQAKDMRAAGFPIVLTMIRDYFPFGTGFGSFDPVFRMHEPLSFLGPTYFNHAHNDFLEVVLDAGLPGLFVLMAALGWWAWASVIAWGARGSHALPKLGSSIILLVIIASIFDYPARTPMMMVVTIVAAVWLGTAGEGARGTPLPADEQHL